MTIQIRDAALEERLRKQMAITSSESIEEVLAHLLHTQEEQDRWLALNRAMINAKIERGIEQLDRGEGITENTVREHLAARRSKRR